jgi:hypothetical protein
VGREGGSTLGRDLGRMAAQIVPCRQSTASHRAGTRKKVIQGRLGLEGERIRRNGIKSIYTLHIKITSRLAPIIISTIARKRDRKRVERGWGELYHTPVSMRLIKGSEALVTGTWYHQGYWRYMVVNGLVLACIG